MASGVTSAALATALAADSDVEWAEVDHRRYALVAPVNYLLDPDNVSSAVAPAGPVSGQWYRRAPGIDSQGYDVVSSINIEPAWAITHGSASIVIGDVDTGITPHPDLDSKMLTGYDFISDVATANDGNGRDDNDPSDPGDYVTAAENSNKTGAFFGCNEATAPAAGPWGPRAAGMARKPPASSVRSPTTASAWPASADLRVLPVRVLGKCGGYPSDIMAGMSGPPALLCPERRANPNPAKVINMSLGGDGACSQAYTTPLTNSPHGVVVVVVCRQRRRPRHRHASQLQGA